MQVNNITSQKFDEMVNNCKYIKESKLPPKTKFPRIMEGIVFETIDFNHPILGGFLTKPIIRKCNFLDVNFDGINAEKSLFEDCIFDKVIFGKEFTGRIDLSKFVNCTFKESEFAYSKFEKTVFIDCTFNNCKFTKINFNYCSFENIIFTGTFKTVNWVSCNTTAVDVSEVLMKDASILSADSYDIKLPDNKVNFLIRGSSFDYCKEKIQTKLTTKTFEEFCYLGEFVSRYKNGVIIDEDFFREASKVEKKIIMEALYLFKKS